ncbi:FAD-binding oxidoreductase [Microvirga subterranea]|uniref:FAD/FMN-containing dehydrogenase n=1 Tax=Microvirga subterranea TaxID=186651 RepID=A0A370HG63_9HYPH|nr:FAD-binding oxidoreductase [Microvirga subterranea]RDI56362.1 FAD/FMN-containing dehydrogenase [Microvirga subterranea]
MTAVLDALLTALGRECVRIGSDIPDRNFGDASGARQHAPLALLLPRSTEEVSRCLAICHAHGHRVVPQGGMTGLAGGANPQENEIALSLERMTGVEEIDRDSATLTALAGTPLAVIQSAAEEAGFLCGIDLGARGTCTIGGNVATNAGGNQVLRYGMTRRNVLGLEVVLADGRVLRSLNKMMKNNAGYDWTQLFIGSEGTLGIVTRVVLALHPSPKGLTSALCAVDSFGDALAVLRRFDSRFPGRLLVFEAMWREYMDVAIDRSRLTQPFADRHEITLLIEAAMGEDPGAEDAFGEALAEFIDDGVLKDALVAQSGNDRKKFWAYREANYEFGRVLPEGSHFDVSIPLSRMAEAVDLLRQRCARWPNATLIVFGHVADSNIHLSLCDESYDDAVGRAMNEVVYGVVAEVSGTVSAEHGIGVLKRPYLGMSRTEAELDLMRTLKHALDPKGILNPGRVLAPA